MQVQGRGKSWYLKRYLKELGRADLDDVGDDSQYFQLKNRLLDLVVPSLDPACLTLT